MKSNIGKNTQNIHMKPKNKSVIRLFEQKKIEKVLLLFLQPKDTPVVFKLKYPSVDISRISHRSDLSTCQIFNGLLSID